MTIKKVTIYIFSLLAILAWGSSASAAITCPQDNGAGVGCNAEIGQYYCRSACRQLTTSPFPTWAFCADKPATVACADGADCSNSSNYPCGVPESCNSGYTLCSSTGTANPPSGSTTWMNVACKQNVTVPTGCLSYNQCTNVCSSCSAGYELISGSCVGATVKLGQDSVLYDRLKNSTNPLMSIFSSGNVAIGTTTASNKLFIDGGTNNVLNVNGGRIVGLNDVPVNDDEAVSLSYLENNYTSAVTATANSLWSGTKDGNIWNGTSGTGNVGIGTSNPGAVLQVDTPTSNSLGNGIRINRPTSAYYSGLEYATNGAIDWSQGVNSAGFGIYENGLAATTRLLIKDGGNVGIGTTDPNSKLDINGTINSGSLGVPGTLLLNWSGDGGGGAVFEMRSSIELSMSKSRGRSSEILMGNSYGYNFKVEGNSALYITNSATSNAGNVGIGTTTPSAKLSVAGTTGEIVNVNGGRIMGLNDTPVNDDEAIPLGYLEDNYTLTENGLWSGTKDGNIWNGASGTGNVGIGTTEPSKKLEVLNGRVRIREMSSNDYAVLEFGNNTEGLVGGFFLAGSAASGYGGVNSLNLINVRAFPLALGTSNSVDLFIDSIGNVGIGTTAPEYELDVVGGNINLQTDVKNSGYLINGMNAVALDGSSTSQNIFIGKSGNTTITGTGNYLMGYNAGDSLTTGIQNILLGIQSGEDLTTGSNNIIIGRQNARYMTSGDANTIIGTYAGYNATGSNNVFLGLQAGYYETGSNTLFIDNQGRTSEALGRTSALIYGKFDVTPVNQILSLGGGGNVGIGTTAPLDKLDVSGNIRMGTISGSNNGIYGYNTTPTLLHSITRQDSLGSGAGDLALGAYRGIGFKAGQALPTSYDMYIWGGNVGIGTTTPTAKLSIAGTTGEIVNVNGGRIMGLNDTPVNDDEAVSLSYLEDNYFSMASTTEAFGVSSISLTDSTYNGNMTYTGGFTGYDAANKICNDFDPGSHFCRTDEIMYLIQENGAIGFASINDSNAWIADGPPGFTGTISADDCAGWTDGTDDKLGHFWMYNSSGGGRGSLIGCDNLKQITCCK